MNIFSSHNGAKHNGGFILLFSVLIMSILLAIGLSIYSLSVKEVVLASFLRNSEKAFIAADRALECALYWERSYPQNGLPYTAFATSTAWSLTVAELATVECDGQPLTSLSSWDNTTGRTATAGRTYFSIIFADDLTCAEVEVSRTALETTIISNGYNDCTATNPRRTQRTIQVTTNL